jgi:hypothetical protein
MTCLVTTCQAQIVVLSVDSNVFVVSLAQLLNSGFDCLHTSGLTHRLRAVVGVATGTVPFALERLGVERNLDAPLLSNAGEKVASHPEVVTHGNAFTGANLEFPLRRHNLGVDSANVDAGVEASTVMGFDEITGEDFAGS